MKYGANDRRFDPPHVDPEAVVRARLVSQVGLADIRNVIVETGTLWGNYASRRTRAARRQFPLRLVAVRESVGGKTNSALRVNQSGSAFTAGNSYGGIADDGTKATVRRRTTPRP